MPDIRSAFMRWSHLFVYFSQCFTLLGGLEMGLIIAKPELSADDWRLFMYWGAFAVAFVAVGVVCGEISLNNMRKKDDELEYDLNVAIASPIEKTTNLELTIRNLQQANGEQSTNIDNMQTQIKALEEKIAALEAQKQPKSEITKT